MNARDDITYRIALADGFLQEAEQDWRLQRWRSCVDNAQLAVENAGKAVLLLFGVVPRTHEPARELVAILRAHELPEPIQDVLRHMLPDLLALGATEHFMTDYGDETTYTLPWELYTQEPAQEALAVARRSVQSAREVIRVVEDWWAEETDDNEP